MLKRKQCDELISESQELDEYKEPAKHARLETLLQALPQELPQAQLQILPKELLRYGPEGTAAVAENMTFTFSNLHGAYFRCRICPSVFGPKRGKLLLKRHMSIHTPKVYSLGCPHCEKFFGDPTSFKRHTNRQHSERLFPCALCGKVLKNKDALKAHMKALIHAPSATGPARVEESVAEIVAAPALCSFCPGPEAAAVCYHCGADQA